MRKLFFLTVIFVSVFFNTLNAEQIKNVEVVGNKRITKETIMVFAGIEINSQINSNQDLNNILKDLYETNYFSNVELEFKNNNLIINVTENPIIQSIVLDGIKAKKFKEAILENLTLKEKTSYVENFVEQDIEKIKSILKKSGFYFVEVELSVIESQNLSVILSYNVDLGKKAKIRKINFLGEKIFKDRKLRNVIVSEEYKPWKFISSKKYLNEERIELDKRLLKNFYLNRGYFNVEILTTYAEYLDNHEFDLTYSINAGNKVFFDKLTLNVSDEYDVETFSKVNKYLNKLKGKHYSLDAVEKISKLIENITLENQLEFVNVSIDEKVNEENKLQFTINLDEEKRKFYVNRINIIGNNITEESVIRNQLLIDEGDSFNSLLFNKSMNNLKAINLFAKVKSKILDSDIPQKKDIEIEVEDKATGEISAGAGVGTDGGTIGFNIKENNYLGKGLKLSVGLTLNEESIKGNFRYLNPKYKNSDKSLDFGISSETTDRLAEFGYKSSEAGFYFGTGYEQFDDFYFRPKLSVAYDKIETSNDASTNLKKQEGDYFASKVIYSIDYDKRNRRFQATSGYRHNFSQSLPIYSKTYAFRNTYEYNHYFQLSENIVTGMSFYGSAIATIKSDNDVRISERLYIPSSKLRGFQTGKIGPKDGEDFVGGNYASAININSDLPILSRSQNTDVKVFFDAANLWGADYINDDGKSSYIRSSTGIALDWFTPVGPLNFSLAKPITKKESDKTESFRFNIGTTF